MQQPFRSDTVSSYYSLSVRTPPLSKLAILQPDLEPAVSPIKPVLEILKDLDTDCTLLEANALTEDPASENAIALRILKGQIETTARLFVK